MIKGLGTGVWAKPFEAVTHGNFAHGESVSLQCRYRAAMRRNLLCVYRCRGGGGKELKSRYVLGIPTSLALLCLVVIVEKHTHTHLTALFPGLPR